MRPLWKDALIAIWLGMILPGIVLNGFVLLDRRGRTHPITELPTEPAAITGPVIPVRCEDEKIAEMELDGYLTGVVLAEMPAQFHPEALKAQSVAARTYAWKAVTTGGKHGDGSICTDSACCQAYISREDYLSRGGTPENLEKVRLAVQTTSPMVLSYEGELIEATYFSSSGGSTEAAVAVWGTDFPYLQAVSSPEDGVKDTVAYSREELQNLLGIDLSENPSEWIESVTYSAGGGVATMDICGVSFTGVALRSILGLRSTAFQTQPEGDAILFTTSGYGHRVGMSQYGANAFAESGSTWQEILQHYYPGTILHPAY